MTEHKTIYAALAAAQLEMGKALKDSVNPAFKSKYADLASVMDACLPALNKNGIAVFQPAFDDETGRYVETIFAHVSGEIIKCRVPLIIGKNDMQGYGSAATYARRYGLMGMAGIAPEDDDGNAAVKAAPKQDASAKAVGEACAYLASATDLSDLKSKWSNLPTAIQAESSVIAAKESAKAMMKPVAADLAGDVIPY